MRLIDADELHEIVNWSHEKPPYSKKKIHRLIDMTRTVDAEPVKHGKWRHYERMLTCSECGTVFYDDIMEYFGDEVPRYCPECGARMDL